MDDVGAFIGAVVWNYWTLVSGIVLVAEPFMRFSWSGYDTWASRWLDDRLRRRVARSIALFAFICANFLAYHGVRDDWRMAVATRAHENRDVATREITVGDKYVVTEADHVIVINKPDASPIDVVLPPNPSPGRRLEIKYGSSKQGMTITVRGNGRKLYP